MSDQKLQSVLLEKELSFLDEAVNDEATEDAEDEEENVIIATPSALFGPGVDTLWRKKRRAGTGRTGLTAGKKLPQAVSKLLGNAHEAFICGDYVTAVSLYSEVTQLAPKLPDPYGTMALIYEETGDLESALRLYVVTAKLTPRAYDIWCKIADMAFELRDLPIALLAITRVMSQDKSMDIYTKKIILLVEVHNINLAEVTLAKMLHHYPTEYDFLLEYGMVCQSNNYFSQAVNAYIRFIEHTVSALRQGHAKRMRRITDANAGAHMSEITKEIDMCDRLFFACRKLGEVNLCVLPDTEQVASTTQLISCVNACCDCGRACGLLPGLSAMTSHGPTQTRHTSIPMDVIFLTCLCELEQALSTAPTPVAHMRPVAALSGAQSGERASGPAEEKASSISSVPGISTRLYQHTLVDILSQYGEWELEVRSEGNPVAQKSKAMGIAGVQDIFQIMFPLLKQLRNEEDAVSKRLQSARNSSSAAGNTDDLDAAQWLSSHALKTDVRTGADVPGEREVRDGVERSASSKQIEDISDSSTPPADSESGESTLPLRSIGDWEFLLSARIRVASLLLELGLHRKALDISRGVVSSPFLRPPLIAAGKVAELCKRHCGHVLYALSIAPPSACDDRMALQEEVLQMCMLVLQQDPGDSEVLITFASFCRHHRPDFLNRALDMLHVHFLTLLTHFENVSYRLKGKATFQSVITCENVKVAETEVITSHNIVSSDLSLSEGMRKYINSIVDAAAAESGLSKVHEGDEGVAVKERGARESHLKIVHADVDRDAENDDDDDEVSGDRQPDDKDSSGGGEEGMFMFQVHRELRALLHWARLLRDVHQDKLGFCSLILPFLEVCNQHEVEKKSGQSRKRKVKAVSAQRLWLKNGVLAYQPLEWMDNVQNSFSRMVYALCLHVPHMLSILDRESMQLLARHVSEDLREVGGESAEELRQKWSRAFGLGRSNYRKKRIQGALSRATGGDDESSDRSDVASAKRRRVVSFALGEEGGMETGDPEEFDEEEVDLSIIPQANEFVRDMLAWEYCNEEDILAAERRASYMSTLLKAQPDYLASLVMAGNEQVASHRYGDALEKYLRAFRIDPHQPLTSLCVASTLAYIAVHPLTAHKQDVCGKSLAFFSHYAQMRTLTGKCSGATEAHLQQEIFYNIGCFYMDIRLNHLAVDFFLKAIDVLPAGQEMRSAHLTREAAFNLSLVYRQSGNDTMAYDIMKSYLSFE